MHKSPLISINIVEKDFLKKAQKTPFLSGKKKKLRLKNVSTISRGNLSFFFFCEFSPQGFSVYLY